MIARHPAVEIGNGQLGDLIAKVTNEAQQKDYFKEIAPNVLAIDEEKFPDEMEVIKRYQDSMALSPTLRDIVETFSILLARDIERAMPFKITEPLWPHVPIDHKKMILNAILQKQAELFSRTGLQFEAAEVVFEESPLEGILAHVVMPPLDQEEFMLPNVSINQDLLQENKFGTVIFAAVHEGLHNVMSQLARKYFTGEIGEDHPFYRDAQIIFEMRTNRANGPIALRSAYSGDPEETLVTDGHLLFNRAYTAPESLSTPAPDFTLKPR